MSRQPNPDYNVFNDRPTLAFPKPTAEWEGDGEAFRAVQGSWTDLGGDEIAGAVKPYRPMGLGDQACIHAKPWTPQRNGFLGGQQTYPAASRSASQRILCVQHLRRFFA